MNKIKSVDPTSILGKDYQHLAIVEDTKTGLHHGAVYRNRPTPSGCDRLLLAFTTTQGYATLRSAAIAINKGFAHLEPINLSDIPEETDDDIERLIALLPQGALLTEMTPLRGDKMEKGVTAVEVHLFNSIKAPRLAITVSRSQLKALVARRVVEFDSTSGDDPELYYRYDHYIVE